VLPSCPNRGRSIYYLKGLRWAPWDRKRVGGEKTGLLAAGQITPALGDIEASREAPLCVPHQVRDIYLHWIILPSSFFSSSHQFGPAFRIYSPVLRGEERAQKEERCAANKIGSLDHYIRQFII